MTARSTLSDAARSINRAVKSRAKLCSPRAPNGISQPSDAVGQQIDTQQQSEHPHAARGKARDDDQARKNAEQARAQHDPAEFPPMADADEYADEAGDQEHQAKDVGQDKRADHRLAHQRQAEDDIQDAEQHLPDEPSPSLGPEGVDDLESTGHDGHPADEDRADQGEEGDVAEDEKAGHDHEDSKQDTYPQRRRRQSCEWHRSAVSKQRTHVSPSFLDD